MANHICCFIRQIKSDLFRRAPFCSSASGCPVISLREFSNLLMQFQHEPIIIPMKTIGLSIGGGSTLKPGG